MDTRQELRFAVAGESCAAWFYPGSGPVVVMAHGLTGTRRDRLGPFAERFAAAGYGALVFDHRGFGDSEGEPDLFHPRRQAEDWDAAIAFVRTLDGVDPDQVVTFGSSMGGGNALAAASRDPGVVAAISQVPFLDLITQAASTTWRTLPRLVWAGIRNQYVAAVGQPGEVAFINAPASEAGWRAVVGGGEDSRWRDRVSARWLLGMPFRPGRRARRLHCPWLVCVGGADQVARPGPAIRAARRAPYGELKIYPGVDHFDIYSGPAYEQLVADQLEFLKRLTS